MPFWEGSSDEVIAQVPICPKIAASFRKGRALTSQMSSHCLQQIQIGPDWKSTSDLVAVTEPRAIHINLQEEFELSLNPHLLKLSQIGPFRESAVDLVPMKLPASI